MKPFTSEDVEAACNKLRPIAQKLVDRFGQAQAFEIMSDVARTVCPDGMTKAPQVYCLPSDEKAVNWIKTGAPAWLSDRERRTAMSKIGVLRELLFELLQERDRAWRAMRAHGPAGVT